MEEGLAKMIVKRAKSYKIQAYENIKHLIIERKLKQNVIYSEQMMADQFGISRTPIREALTQLEAEGFTQTLPCKGFQIRKLTVSDVSEIFQMRIAIESYCASALAKKSENLNAQAYIQKAKIHLDRCKEDFNRKDDIDFHEEIVKSSGNKLMISAFDEMRAKTDYVWSDIVISKNRDQEIINEHEAVFDAIASGDSEAAYRAVEDHLTKAFDKYVEALSKRDRE